MHAPYRGGWLFMFRPPFLLLVQLNALMLLITRSHRPYVMMREVVHDGPCGLRWPVWPMMTCSVHNIIMTNVIVLKLLIADHHILFRDEPT